MSKNPTLEERVKGVEVEIRYLRDDIKSMTKKGEKVSARLASVSTRLTKLSNHISNIATQCGQLEAGMKKLQDGLAALKPTMSGRDKAAIAVALISGIVSIVVVVVQNIPK